MSDVAFQTSTDATNVKSIEFRDGTRLTFEQAAKFYSSCYRCTRRVARMWELHRTVMVL